MRLDARKMGKRNLASNGAGQMSVRPGLRRLLTTGSTALYGGWTFVDGRTMERRHAVVQGGNSAPLDLSLVVYDDTLEAIFSQSLGSNAVPRGFSGGQVLQYGVVGSPDIPTCWAMIPSRFNVAQKYQPDDIALTAIDIPRGLVASWVNRIVIADGPNLYISVPVAITGGSPLTYFGQNVSSRPGSVFGLHVGAGGSLVACTTRGVFALDSAAAAVGIVGSNGSDWRLLSHHETVSFDSTCAVNGRIYGLTKRGFRLIDTEDGPETDLDDKMLSFSLGTRVSNADYRECRMYAGPDGPVIYSPTSKALYVTELEGIDSWWTTTTTTSDIVFDVRGVLWDTDGSPILITTDGLWYITGNFDGGLSGLADAFAVQPTGFVFDQVNVPPDENFTVRAVHIAAAQGTVSTGVRGEVQTDAGYSDVGGPIIGTSSWGGSWRYMTAPQVAHRTQYDINSNDLAVEAGVAGCDNRLGEVLTIDDGQQGKRRPQDRG